MPNGKKTIRITHRPTGAVIAEGPSGWGITPFENGYYIRRAHLKEGRFKPSLVPGLCPYKFLYVGMSYHPPRGEPDHHLGWLYWLPNPLLPFIWYRVALPRSHPSLLVETFAGGPLRSRERPPGS